VLSCFLTLALWLGVAVPGGEPIATKHLTIATSASQAAVAPGGRVALNIDVAPKPTMHVYAPGQKDYIAVSVTLEGNPSIKPATAQFPKPEKREVKALGEIQLVYSKPFRIVQDITLDRRPSSGPLTIKGAVKYQACDESICYAPITVSVTWTLTVKKPAGR
jgi:DsbC/DsbD-like thiol-disulfide interchange protein